MADWVTVWRALNNFKIYDEAMELLNQRGAHRRCVLNA